MSRARDVANLGSDTTNLEDISSAYNAGALSNRNKIINGAMVIDQRNAGASVTANGGIFPVDRFVFNTSEDGKATAQRSTVSPSGFTNSLLYTSSSAYSVLSSDIFLLEHRLEGFNTSDLGFGTASASTVTVSFWVRSSLTGSFGGALTNSARDRSYPFSYTISAADTWEYKTVTIDGDTSGTWSTDNSRSLILIWSLGAGSTSSGTAGAWSGSTLTQPTGSTSVVATNGATWQITGVQLEAGTVATPFEHRSFGQELALCQRYYYRALVEGVGDDFAVGSNATTTASRVAVFFPTQMRTAPTALEQSGTSGDYSVRHGGSIANCSSVPTFFNANKNFASTQLTVSSGLTAGQGSFARAVNTNAFFGWSAEL